MNHENSTVNQKTKRMYGIFAAFGVIVLTAIDQITKFLAVKYLTDAPYELIPGVFELHYLENRGTAFGMMQGKQMLLLMVTILVLILALVYFIKLPWTRQMNFLRVLAVFVIAGGIGNMIDRVRVHYVIDFLYLKIINFPIFNIADIYVTCSIVIICIYVMFFLSEEDMNAFRLFGNNKKTKNE